MRDLWRENIGEALIGLLVVLVAAWFVQAAWTRTGGGISGETMHVSGLFPSVVGVTLGTDVRVAGIKVGSVTAQKLDPESYQAELILSLDPKLKIPADSSAAITSEGLMGGTYISLLPGGDTEILKNGDVILDTQGSMDMMGLVGQMINKSGDEPVAEDKPAVADAAATPAL
ncbi:outer membrane lipid asymmetry maintenance protein MlaD [Aquisediminimonas sediminicola]|uniref:outer membrane lipid asymmetry maintenance protein MlaD n=1 Tax=Alteraquisediminimonas sediminicola TaxID=2676787 RepID=UPI001C8EFA7C|nr:outer membrane lipid asymmetry maintenance protein MlaD [Aquisediminimonas sediminicola]